MDRSTAFAFQSVGFLNSEKNMLLESPRSDNSPLAADTDGILDITIHRANNLHNICIYGNQDVYAKFSITQCQDAVYSTRPVKAGGRNPAFNQSLQIPVSRPDAVLKCEIWMMSSFRHYLQDQLLGFVLVPLGDLFGKEKQTRDYCLTSTELFHTPAGSVCLSLLFHRRSDGILEHELSSKMLQDGDLAACCPENASPVDLNNIEFPDLDAASENQHLVSAYLKMAAGNNGSGYPETRDAPVLGRGGGRHEDGLSPESRDLMGAPFLQLGVSPIEEVDCEITLNSGEENSMEVSTVTSNAHVVSYASPASHAVSGKSLVVSSDTEHLSRAGQALSRDSTNGLVSTDNNLCKSDPIASRLSSVQGSGDFSTVMDEKQDQGNAISTSEQGDDSFVFTTPLVKIPDETEVPVVQQQIVDMYMKSMQQFTEKLAEMKLPLAVKPQDSAVTSNMKFDKKDAEEGKKVEQKFFYGSRAFF